MIRLDSAVATPQQIRQLTAALRGQPTSFVETLLGAIRGGHRRRTRGPDAAVWGAPPGSAALQRAALDNLARSVERRRAVVEASLTRAEVAARLGKTAQAVSAMLERGALIGLKEGREWRIPAWQLDADLADGVLPGLAPLLAAFRDGVVSLSEWVERPHPDLDGRTPRTALARGEVDRVVAAARIE